MTQRPNLKQVPEKQDRVYINVNNNVTRIEEKEMCVYKHRIETKI